MKETRRIHVDIHIKMSVQFSGCVGVNGRCFCLSHGLKRQKSSARAEVVDCSCPSKHTITRLSQLQCLWACWVERTGWTGNTADEPRDTLSVCLPLKLQFKNHRKLLCEITENAANKTNQSEAERGGTCENSGQQSAYQWSGGWSWTAGHVFLLSTKLFKTQRRIYIYYLDSWWSQCTEVWIFLLLSFVSCFILFILFFLLRYLFYYHCCCRLKFALYYLILLDSSDNTVLSLTLHTHAAHLLVLEYFSSSTDK